tara:strand:+ start:199 stop:744 length:546 start_codon:yes stop_codon:yes gene_type:complete
MVDKFYVKYDDVHHEVESLYRQIENSNYLPDYIIAIGTGGFIPARILRSYLNIPIICITVGFYNKSDKLHKKAKRIQMIEKNSSEHKMIKGKNIIVIDELDDTRSTLQYVTDLLLDLEPKEISVGVLHNKKKKKVGKLNKSIKYFSGKIIADKWVVYPWESTNIEEHNQLCKKGKYVDCNK